MCPSTGPRPCEAARRGAGAGGRRSRAVQGATNYGKAVGLMEQMVRCVCTVSCLHRPAAARHSGGAGAARGGGWRTRRGHDTHALGSRRGRWRADAGWPPRISTEVAADIALALSLTLNSWNAWRLARLEHPHSFSTAHSVVGLLLRDRLPLAARRAGKERGHSSWANRAISSRFWPPYKEYPQASTSTICSNPARLY